MDCKVCFKPEQFCTCADAHVKHAKHQKEQLQRERGQGAVQGGDASSVQASPPSEIAAEPPPPPELNESEELPVQEVAPKKKKGRFGR